MASFPATARSLSRSESLVDRGRRRDEDGGDDEAEIWAALERLPTYDRMRTVALQKGRGSGPLKDLVLSEYLVNQLFKLTSPEEGNEKFLSKLRARIDAAGVEVPTVEVRYQDLTVEGEVYVGTRGLPTLFNTVFNFAEMFMVSSGLFRTKKRNLTILEGVSGILKPGRMTLLLGPPSSGKSTLLLALAGRLDPNLKVNGTIMYNGFKLDEFEPRKTAAYISQQDLFQAEFTVRETMEYSSRFQGAGPRHDVISELVKREKEQGIQPDPEIDLFMKASVDKEIGHELVTAYVIKLLGLDICADTMVGDQMIRGISGGQRKRLTTGEMLVGPAAALFMDEITTGLDSSTAFQVVKCISQTTHIFQTTVMVSLLQPAPETYELFDDVIVVAGGSIVYNGPIESVREFFETCGFTCPARKNVPDFLQEVTSAKDQEQYWTDKSKPYKFVPVCEFVEAFKRYHLCQEMSRELTAPCGKNPSGMIFQHWSLSQWALFKITLDKEILLLRRNYLLPVFNVAQLTVMSLLEGTLFFRTRMHHRNLVDAQLYAGALFYILNQLVFVGYSEITFTAIRFPVFQKSRELQFYPPWTWALSLFLIKIPFSILESFAVSSVTYYTIDLAPSFSRFLRLWLLLALADQTGSGLFRMLAGLCKTFVLATSVGGFALTAILVLGGFVIPRTYLKPFWVWAYWASPLGYMQNAVIDNEYLAPRWNKDRPNDGKPLGHRFILAMGLFDKGFWFWMVCGLLIAYTLAFYLVFAWSITFTDAPGKSRAQLSKELLEEMQMHRTGKGFDSSDSGKSFATVRSIYSGLKSGAKSKSSSGRRGTIQESSQGRSGSTSPIPGDSDANRVDPGALQMITEPGSASNSSIARSGSPSSSRGSGKGPRTGMILPFQPLAISFKDINYYVDMPLEQRQKGVPQNRLQLLQGITGSFRPGVLTALVGVTGAGKTTLMDVLAGRKNKGYIEGDIRISGFPKKQETFARICGYCEQNDIHSSPVTVQESLVFSAWLRLSREIPPETKMEFVKQVMSLVELSSLRHALVGVPGESGLSLEQRKRLTIAVELVANPSIIFMDEPTSGLDARAAATVMRTVRNTVDTGRSVVCTIHQPSIDIFEAFDELLLLKTGGRTIYAGSLGRNSQELINYFEIAYYELIRYILNRFGIQMDINGQKLQPGSGINGVQKIKEGVNPAAWMLEISTHGMEEKLGLDFAEIYQRSPIYATNVALVDELSKPHPNATDLSFPTKYSQPLWTQFTCCLWKQYWAYWRSPAYNLMRLALCVFASLFFGSVFWGLGKKLGTQRRLFTLMGAILTSQSFYGVLTATAVQPLIAAERTVFYRERSAGMYSEIAYAVAQCAIELPYLLISSSTFGLISFSMIQLEWKAKKFFWYLFFVFFSQTTNVFWGMMTVSLTPNAPSGAILSGLIYNYWGIFNGFAISYPKFPIYWKWTYWINPQAYHLYGTTVSQFGDLSNVYTVSHLGTRVPVKELIRSAYGFKYSHLAFIGTVTFFVPVAFAIIFILCIRFLNYQQR